MRACVTGGTGFVGSHIVRALLEDGHPVRVLHRTTSKLTALYELDYEPAIGDVTDLDSMRVAFAGCDWVFHVAAVADYWRANKQWMFEVNVTGTGKVLQAAREAGVRRVLFTSSAAALGLPENGTLANESTPFNLSPQRFPYGYSKVQAEAVVQEAVEQGQDVVILNPVIVIGPGDLNLISGSFITQMKKWQWLTPGAPGGLAVIDVRDVAAAHLAAAKQGKTGERYLLSTANYSFKEWFQLIAEELDVAPPLIQTPGFALPVVASSIALLRRIGIPTPVDANQVRLGKRRLHYDASKAHAALHQPQIAMRQSIQDTYQWYLENGYLKESRLADVIRQMGLWLRSGK